MNTVTNAQSCQCGHLRDAHQHYRKGSDCGICGADVCARFRPAGRSGRSVRQVLERLFRR